jgi:hypothetical protein
MKDGAVVVREQAMEGFLESIGTQERRAPRMDHRPGAWEGLWMKAEFLTGLVGLSCWFLTIVSVPSTV